MRHQGSNHEGIDNVFSYFFVLQLKTGVVFPRSLEEIPLIPFKFVSLITDLKEIQRDLDWIGYGVFSMAG